MHILRSAHCLSVAFECRCLFFDCVVVAGRSHYHHRRRPIQSSSHRGSSHWKKSCNNTLNVKELEEIIMTILPHTLVIFSTISFRNWRTTKRMHRRSRKSLNSSTSIGQHFLPASSNGRKQTALALQVFLIDEENRVVFFQRRKKRKCATKFVHE